MSRHSGGVDKTHFITLRPAITRAYWAGARAWNGDEIELVVECRHVPDGTSLELAVFGPGNTRIEELTGAAKVQRGRSVTEHKLEWTHEHVKDLPPDLEEPEFHFVVTVPRFELRARSNDLYVDLGGYLVSG